MVKQANAAIAKLDGTPSKGTWSSRKSSKKHKKTAATASQPDPDLWAEYIPGIKQAQDATEKAKAKAEQAALDMFQLYANLLSIKAKYAWNKIVQEQWHLTPTRTYKAVPRKDPGDFCTSQLMTVWCSTFSLYFPTMWLSRRGTTSWTCLRNPSTSACNSLCSASEDAKIHLAVFIFMV